MTPPGDRTQALLRLTLTPGCGPIIIRRLLEAFGSPDAVLGASASQLERVRSVGRARSVEIRRGMDAAESLLRTEIERAAALGARIIDDADPDYPPLLAQVPDAPPILYVRGTLDSAGADRYPVAIVGARECSAYGIEQAGRFAGILAGAGLTIVSGGARGIDSAAHRGALSAQGRTICVLGCGLAHAYPPENGDLFAAIAAGHGAVISELPLDTAPKPENFPARNRIIAGASLGVIVVEAGERSGALITARLAAEDYGREVMALPGRVDAAASRGCLKLIKDGGAALITEPGDVLSLLESPARHSHFGSHEARFAPLHTPEGTESEDLFQPQPADRPIPTGSPLTDHQRAILNTLEEPQTLDELASMTGLTPAALRSELTLLEVQQRVRRHGSKFEKRS